MAATGDRVPCVYVENRRVVGLDPTDPIRVSYGQPLGDWPTGRGNPDLLKVHPSHGHDQTIVNGISRIGYMTGGKAALWKDEDMADVFTAQGDRASSSSTARRPFFLFFAPHDPHVPRVPHPRFAGTTPMGPRGDAIAQLDWSVGEVLATLDRLELAQQHARALHQRQRPGASTTAIATRRSRSSATTRRPGRSAAASTATSRAARACRSSCAGRRA